MSSYASTDTCKYILFGHVLCYHNMCCWWELIIFLCFTFSGSQRTFQDWHWSQRCWPCSHKSKRRFPTVLMGKKMGRYFAFCLMIFNSYIALVTLIFFYRESNTVGGWRFSTFLVKCQGIFTFHLDGHQRQTERTLGLMSHLKDIIMCWPHYSQQKRPLSWSDGFNVFRMLHKFKLDGSFICWIAALFNLNEALVFTNNLGSGSCLFR